VAGHRSLGQQRLISISGKQSGSSGIKNGATIENARCAITTCQKDTVGNILWNYTGGIIHAKMLILLITEK